jgi:hypothetical protein
MRRHWVVQQRRIGSVWVEFHLLRGFDDEDSAVGERSIYSYRIAQVFYPSQELLFHEHIFCSGS